MDKILNIVKTLEKSESLDDQYYYTLIHDSVAALLDREINQLFQLLYRIDISEQAVKKVFLENNDKTHISEQLTHLIIERIKQKIALRKKYSPKDNPEY